MAIEQIIEPRPHRIGPVPIRRILPRRDRRMVGPFIFMDQGGPLELRRTGAGGVPEHPHAGLSTFTYLMDGRQLHRDSAGHEAVFAPGDIALMSAGRGITHEELPDPADTAPTAKIYFAQMWLALPDAVEDMPPTFEHHRRDALPVVEGDGARVRLAMGSAWGATAPTTCHAPTLFADITLDAGGRMPITAEHDERAVMLLEGEAALDGVPLKAHALNVLTPDAATLTSASGGRALVFGGARFESPRWIGGSFVASSPEKLRRWMRESATSAWPRIQR